MAFEKVYSCNLRPHTFVMVVRAQNEEEQISHSNNSIIIPFSSCLNIRNPYLLFSFNLFESQKACKLF